MKCLASRFWAVLDYAEYLRTFARLAVLDWLAPPKETPVDRAIREEGERLRKAFPWLDERRPRRARPAIRMGELPRPHRPPDPRL